MHSKAAERPEITRRAFIRTGGAVLAAVAASPVGSAFQPFDRLLQKRPRATDGSYPESSDLASHVLSRLTFGPRPGDRAGLLAMGSDPDSAVYAWIELQLHPEGIDDTVAERKVRRLESLALPVAECFEIKPEVLLRELTAGAVCRAVYSERQLLERLVHFWSDHFNIDCSKGDCRWLIVSDNRDVIRRHALGRFRDLLGASALSPAMLWYLDGRENRRRTAEQVPNENYARELLELHTLGVQGGYTQQDVMEAARCLTGWTVRDRSRLRKAQVAFDPSAHDDGPKTVLGRPIAAGGGATDVDNLLDIVAFHPSTACHIAHRLAGFLVSDVPPADSVEAAAAAFTNSGGDIRATVRALLRSEGFRASPSAKLRRPFEFVAASLRGLEADTDGGPAIAEYLRRMGHGPHQFPTPDGYPIEAQPWFGTLLWRWRFATALTGGELKGTRVDVQSLTDRLGGTAAVATCLLGRHLTNAEETEMAPAGYDPALVLCSPAFQLC